jgi:enamine deaminase RidA (YjgF/YER057c/UK114 family)
MIERVRGDYPGRSRASIHNGLIYTVGTDIASSPTVAEQTRRILSDLESVLDAAGSGKDKIVQATVYLRDMTTKPEMDAVWCDWIGPPENWPQRACIGTDLAEDDRVEIVLVAAVG